MGSSGTYAAVCSIVRFRGHHQLLAISPGNVPPRIVNPSLCSASGLIDWAESDTRPSPHEVDPPGNIPTLPRPKPWLMGLTTLPTTLSNVLIFVEPPVEKVPSGIGPTFSDVWCSGD